MTTLSIVAASSAAAMSFEASTWRDHFVLPATGIIEQGDRNRFRSALVDLPPMPHGLPVVLLESPGGDVREALAISEMLNEYPVHMVIPKGAECASACASILFIAGEQRTVEAGGRFGQHSCSSQGLRSDFCNEEMASHALLNGVSHGSVKAFTTFVPPSEILWFTRENVDCWGISRYPFSKESDFRRSEPCVIQMISGNVPAAQTAWRVDFLEDGYLAFLRPFADHIRELQVSLFCNETRPGRLFLGMDIAGPSQVISDAIISAELDASPVRLIEAEYTVQQVDTEYSRVIVEIPRAHVIPLLTQTDRLKFTVNVRPPYEVIWVDTRLSGSREALLFAANNCINR